MSKPSQQGSEYIRTETKWLPVPTN